eukprot:9273496-Alexandrium_andersonii.AAC.1
MCIRDSRISAGPALTSTSAGTGRDPAPGGCPDTQGMESPSSLHDVVSAARKTILAPPDASLGIVQDDRHWALE